MAKDAWGWVEQEEERKKTERSNDYFKIEEGKQQFVLLSHFAPFPQVFEKGKYRPAVEGDTNVSVRGVCWVLQDGHVKEAKMPYKVVQAVRELRDDPDWAFEFPFPHTLTLSAKNAGTKEVKYSLTPSPKKVEIPKEVLVELTKKPTPEERVEKLKGAESPSKRDDEEEATSTHYYPTSEEEGINPEDIPFSDE